MNDIALTSRARTRVRLTAAGITALVGTLAAVGSAGAAGAAPSAAEATRITVSSVITCDESDVPFAIDFYYDDHVDGHVPQAVHEEIAENSTVVWTRDELYQEYGNYFNVAAHPGGRGPLNLTSTITYTVTITYDDGVTQTRSTSVDVATARCPELPATPSTTTPESNPTTTRPAAGGTLPTTGTDATLAIGAAGGLLVTTGAALIAGVRRSRTG